MRKVVKPDTSQDTKWTWFQVPQGPKRDGKKIRGPKQNMLKFARQVLLSKPRRKWRQGPTCRRVKVPEDTRSIVEEGGDELGRDGPRPVGLGRLAQPITGPIRPRAKSHCRGSLPPAVNFYRSCVGLGWLAQETTGFILVWASKE
jgi:hypothetical protein